MSGADLLEVEPGKQLGTIVYHGGFGELDGTVGVLSEGLLPEASVLASSNTHAYVASKRVPQTGSEEVVIALDASGEGDPVINIGAREAGTHEPIELDADPELLEGALMVAMRESGVTTARMGERPSHLPERVARRLRLAEDSSGVRISLPKPKPATAPPALAA